MSTDCEILSQTSRPVTVALLNSDVSTARLLAADSRIYLWLDLYNYNQCIRG